MRKLITMPEDLNRRIEAAAAAQTLSMSAWIRQAALEKLEHAERDAMWDAQNRKERTKRASK